ncbi:MAG: ATP-binding protein, partial [Bacteroidota bacterium]
AIQASQFHQAVFSALHEVATQVAYLKGTSPRINVVDRVSSNYYVVNVNSHIEPSVLEHYLKTAFRARQLNTDFEYGIYDCHSDQIIGGRYIAMDDTLQKTPLIFPECTKYTYYFGVRFPTKQAHILSSMDVWIASSILLLLVVIFFGYALFIILRQKRFSEIQKEFVNNMTHEFKTPIATMAIAAKVLQGENIQATPARLQQYASIIATENNRLKEQVERVLQMARLEKKSLQLQKEVIVLHPFIEEITQALQLQHFIKYRLAATPVTIYADKVHLANLILNLLDNAIKYCMDEPHIIIETALTESQVILRIKDHGLGMAKTHQKRVFKRFYRIPTGNVHNVKGFGLGLSYVQLVSRLHRWSLRLESELGQGSTFHITIPFVKN